MGDGWRRTMRGLGGALLLTAALPGLAAAQGAAPPAPSRSAQELKAAIAEIKRKLEEQRQAAGAPAAGDAAEGLRGTRGRLESLAQTMSELRAERDALRGQLLQARDELAKAQQKVAAAEQERSTALAGAEGRIASLEGELGAARQRLEQAEKARAEASAASEQVRQVTTQLQAQLTGARGEVDRLQGLVSANEKAQRTLSQEAERLRLRSGELEGELARVKAEARQGQAETEKRLMAEVARLKDRLATAEREAADLRGVAAASVEEVRSLSEQLLAALAEKDKLVAASVELSSSEALQALQLVAREEAGSGGGLARVEPAAGPAPAPAAATPATLQLAARTEERPRVETWSKTVLEGTLFTPGADRLAPEAAEPLTRIARLIREGNGRVRIVGHTDSNGDADANRRLSLRRAESVRDYLVATHGFDAARFTVDGQGEDSPVTSNDTPAGRRANRRVEVYVAR